VTPRRSHALVPAAITLAGLAVLIGLGLWQLERKTWKEDLIALLEQRLSATPVGLPPRVEWPSLTADRVEFLRVRLQVQFSDADDALVYTPSSALRSDVKAPGYFVFAPARLSTGERVVVNRGYVAERTYSRPQNVMDIVGVLRWPEASSWFVADHDAAGAVWFVRDPLKMAQVRGWGPVAPFYVEQESPVPPSGSPRPGPLTVRLRNDHLQYALTWFGLAAVLVVVFVVWWRRRDVVEGPPDGGRR
jgi:surfeit locus 1 family protein